MFPFISSYSHWFPKLFFTSVPFPRPFQDCCVTCSSSSEPHQWMCLPAPPNWPCTSLMHGWPRRVKKPRSYIPNMLIMMHQSVPEHWLAENIFFYQEAQLQGCWMTWVACYIGQWHSKWSFFFLVWQILRYRIRGKIWLQCFRAFLQCALYLGDPVPISLLIINPLGNVRILSDNQVVADFAEETRPLLVFAHRDYIPLQVPLWTLTELPCRTRTETVSAWNASLEDLLILSTSFYLLSIISVCQISGRTKK